MGRYVYVKEKKRLPNEPGWWPEKKRIEVITTWLKVGNLRVASSICNVPYNTCQVWKRQPWWIEYMRQLREEDGLKQDKKLSSIVEKTLEKLEDRVENGDYILDSKFGTIERIPLKARDIHRIASDFMDKREEIKKLFDAPKQDTNEGVNGRLLKLAEEFAKFANKKVDSFDVGGEKLVNEYIEGEFVNEDQELKIKRKETQEDVLLSDVPS